MTSARVVTGAGAGITIERATPDDDGEVFTLQRAAFVEEARLYTTPFVPPLDETFEDFERRQRRSETWLARASGRRIVGAVSVVSGRNGVPDIERLMVAPDRRGEDIAKLLLERVESQAVSNGYTELRLIVGDLAFDNRQIYEHLGWVEHDTHLLEGFDDVVLHTLSKRLIA